MKFSNIGFLLAIAFAFAFTGCNSFPIKKDSLPKPAEFLPGIKKDAEDDFQQPVKMNIIWKDAVYEKPGVPPVRGFGGRVFFYDLDDKPVKVDGELIVYGFDDTNKKQDSAADVMFVFKREHLQRHYSNTGLGHSYSVWLPWDEFGGMRKTVSLIPVFKTAEGNTLRAGQTLAALPGTEPPEETVEKNMPILDFEGIEKQKPSKQNASMVKQASGIESGDNVVHAQHSQVASDSQKSEMQTTTIRVPRNMANRIKQLPPQNTDSVLAKYRRELETARISARETTRERNKARKEASQSKKSNGESSSIDEEVPNTFPSQKPVFGMPGAFK